MGMTLYFFRIRAAFRAALFHLVGSILVASLAALIVLYIWFPHPYDLLSGGRKLFLVLVGVDVVCGPLLTLILFNPKKSRRELFTDMSLVIVIQLAALAYGVFTAYQARPLFLVHEVDRFRVINLQEFQGENVDDALANLTPSLQPSIFSGPIIVGIRDPKDRNERHEVMLDSITGGRDYAQRPEFYVPYDSQYKLKVMARAGRLQAFVDRFPAVVSTAQELASESGVTFDEARVLPVLHKQEWAAVLDTSGNILGFLPGDAFIVPNASKGGFP